MAVPLISLPAVDAALPSHFPSNGLFKIWNQISHKTLSSLLFSSIAETAAENRFSHLSLAALYESFSLSHHRDLSSSNGQDTISQAVSGADPIASTAEATIGIQICPIVFNPEIIAQSSSFF